MDEHLPVKNQSVYEDFQMDLENLSSLHNRGDSSGYRMSVYEFRRERLEFKSLKQSKSFVQPKPLGIQEEKKEEVKTVTIAK